MAEVNDFDTINSGPRVTEPQAGAPPAPALATTLLLIDFDGTLVEIAERPDAVEVPPHVRELLSDLHQHTDGATVIVSGRRLEDVDRFLPDFPGTVVGSHGAEVKDGGKLWRHEAGSSESLDSIRRLAANWAEGAPDVIVEDKPCSVALHFRQAPDRMGEAEEVLAEAARKHPGFVLHHAKMALEVHPADVSKRAAVETLMRRWPGHVPVAFGDDATDEGMFEAVNVKGGHSIKVGLGDTAAAWRLGGPDDVHGTLRRWLVAAGARR